jgi:tRNA (cmo5U34)-methyltransferase
MKRDILYTKPKQSMPPFEFNREVVEVFDDMIRRSVPGYTEIILKQAQLIRYFYQPKTTIFDLGCSNGNLGLKLLEKYPDLDFKMVAADSSQAMLTTYLKRLQLQEKRERIDLICTDITDLHLSNASVVVINFTLQFLPIAKRDRMIQAIHTALTPGGILLFSEKVYHPNKPLNALQKKCHHQFKRENGYSELEISQKREALENVLIPETIESHATRLTQAGFVHQDIWLKWFNFCSWICLK